MPSNNTASTIIPNLISQLRDNTFHLEAARFMRDSGNVDQQRTIDEREAREIVLFDQLQEEGLQEWEVEQIIFEVRQRWRDNM